MADKVSTVYTTGLWIRLVSRLKHRTEASVSYMRARARFEEDLTVMGVDFIFLTTLIQYVPEEVTDPWVAQATYMLENLGIASAAPRDGHRYELAYLVRGYGELINTGRKVKEATQAFLSL